MSPHRLLIAFLAVLCLILAGVAATTLTGSDAVTLEPSRPGSPASSKIEPTAAKASFSLPALSSFANVTQRSLFSPTRRPAARAADNTGAWSSFALAGIVITPQSRQALVSHGKPPTIAHLAEGQTIEGWTVSAIYPDYVVFSDQLTEHELRLIDKGAAPPPKSTAPPPRRPSP